MTDAAKGDRCSRAVALTRACFSRAHLPTIHPVNADDAGRVDRYPW